MAAYAVTVPHLLSARSGQTDRTNALAAAFGARDHDRLEAAARYLHAVGTPLVEIYEALLARLVDVGPEWISGPRSDPEREIGGFVDDVVNRLREGVVPPTRGTVMLAGIATRHVLGLSALSHVLEDRGWQVRSVRGANTAAVAAEMSTPASDSSDLACVVVALPEGSDQDGLHELYRQLRQLAPGARLVLAGPAAYGDPDLKRRRGVDLVCTHITQVLQLLDLRRQ